MKTKKLSLNDFEAVSHADLLAIKGGEGDTLTQWISDGDQGVCQGDADMFGGTYDMDEVVVYGNASNGPMWSQQTGSWVDQPCAGCADANSIRSGISPLYRYLLGEADSYHRDDCGGLLNPALRNKVYKPF